MSKKRRQNWSKKSRSSTRIASHSTDSSIKICRRWARPPYGVSSKRCRRVVSWQPGCLSNSAMKYCLDFIRKVLHAVTAVRRDSFCAPAPIRRSQTLPILSNAWVYILTQRTQWQFPPVVYLRINVTLLLKVAHFQLPCLQIRRKGVASVRWTGLRVEGLWPFLQNGSALPVFFWAHDKKV